MKQLTTQAIVLARTNYGEADRILTVLTPDQGKLRLLAKGVRRIKSKMAGGIELFSINDITYIVGRGELHTLISSRLIQNFGNIVKNVDRTMYAYDVLKMVNKITEDSPEPEYCQLLAGALHALNNADTSLDCIRVWLNLHLLKLRGHDPNLLTDSHGKALQADDTFMFSFEDMTFNAHASGTFTARHVKLLRLARVSTAPTKLQSASTTELFPSLVQLTGMMLQMSK